jgi:hypothetical protein
MRLAVEIGASPSTVLVGVIVVVVGAAGFRVR